MAGLKSFADTLENELTCSICQDVFTHPKTMPCLHSYCEKCITQWYERSGNKMTKRMNCPMCKSRLDVPDGDPSKLRSSFYLDSLLQLLQATKTKANQPGLSDCVSCEKPQVLVAFCPQCNGLICAECVNAHKTVKQLRDEHQPTMFNDLGQKNVDSFVKNQMLCKEKFHEKNKLEYYCQEETCNRCICQKCFALFHQNHRMQTLEEATEDAKQSIQIEIKRAKELRHKYDQELEQSQKNIKRIIEEIDVAKREARQAEEKICKMARDHTTATISALDQTLREQIKANHEEQSDIKSGIKQVSEFEIHCQTLVERSLECEVMESKKVLQERSELLSKTPSILCNKPIQRDMTVHYAVTGQVMQSLRDIGKIVKSVTDPSKSTIESMKKAPRGFINEFKIMTRNIEGQVRPTRIESLDVKVTDVQGHEVENKVLDERTGEYHVTFKAGKAGPHNIQVHIGGKPINNSPQNVHIIHVKDLFKPVNTFGQLGHGKGELYSPLSIAVSDNGEIAIADCDNHRIQIFSLDGKYLREFGRRGTGEGQLYLPFGVVFNEDRIIVSDSPANKGRIQEFDLNGTYVRTIYRSDQWFVPRGMCVNDDKNIAVCCWGNKELGIKPSIKVLGKQGDLIHEFYMTDYNEQPGYITYSNGKYFVSYCNENCVRVFDENGVFLYKFGEKGEKDGQFDSVRGLAVYGSDMILVCDYNNHRVQLLTQEGQFIRSFGSRGSGVGQMDGPFDVVVTADSRVFVVEFRGHRVSIWC